MHFSNQVSKDGGAGLRDLVRRGGLLGFICKVSTRDRAGGRCGDEPAWIWHPTSTAMVGVSLGCTCGKRREYDRS
jgi:hypothetical protein